MIKFVLGAQGLPDCCKRPFHLNSKQQQALRAEQSISCPFCKNPIALVDEEERNRFANFGNPCFYITIVPRVVLVLIAVSLVIASVTGYLTSLPKEVFFAIVVIGIATAIGGNAYAQHISNRKLRLRLQRVKN
ncbi:hypothetical protein MTZ49_15190 [Entomomonas sp. E2T0]|uniref:hypothetical protein n=1 Tax=Entomomonas sp. E2T0 TaxID=2930213 RepID=UPI0022280FCB|nr:hypothetical protein [Entomomonas sp. E2T0]UYZ83915.1 hypothetical protein MTZ49_15190 [Entomomonas sp. E2T0]